MQKTKRHLLKIVPAVSGLALLFVLVGGTILLLHSPDEVVESESSDDTTEIEPVIAEPKMASVIIEADEGSDWSYNIDDEEIVKISDTQLHKVTDGDDDPTFKHEFIFAGTKKGSTTITILSDDGQKKEYSVIVDDNLNAEASEIIPEVDEN